LLTQLAIQRAHVLGAVEGLGDDDLARSVLPSGWSPAGLVRHLAVDVERWWFRQVVGGEDPAGEDRAGGGIGCGDVPGWEIPPCVAPHEAMDLYRVEVSAADAVIARTPLDAPPASWPVEVWPDWRYEDLCEVLVHVITETACHAGHLDAARELIDGRQWLVLG
jgi:hypothetical protein